MTSNITELIEKFQLIKEKSLNVDFSDALLLGVNAAKGQMQFRIFNEGKDVGGVSLGSYGGQRQNVNLKKLFKGKNKEFYVGEEEVQSTQFTRYEIKRIKAKRQIRYKDLEFLGALRRGIVVIKESQSFVVCAIPNEQLYNISKYQEKAINTIIFALSDEEKELLRTNVIAAVNQIYARIFNSK